MITTEVSLLLLLYLILFFIWRRSRHVIKAMTRIETILNDDDFFGDTVDTSKEGTIEYRKRECLKIVIGSGKAHLLWRKWTHEKADKASDKTINKTYAEYK